MKNREVFYIVEYIIIVVLFVILGSFDEKTKGFAIIIVLLLSIFLLYNKFSNSSPSNTNRKKLLEQLGLGDEAELKQYLSECEVIIHNKLYVKEDTVINIDTNKIYNLYEITEMKKNQQYHRHHVLSYNTYSLLIITETTSDYLDFDTSKNARDCAYLLMSRKISESNKNYDCEICVDILSNMPAYSADEYEGMIMDEEDIKNKENRNDWLGSV